MATEKQFKICYTFRGNPNRHSATVWAPTRKTAVKRFKARKWTIPIQIANCPPKTAKR